ncbi:3'-5' exonuclease family protein [Noviherbaspirillum saxi]|uniref:DNA-directed DNA polymerase n=1 Tax=Noviherbaspirillum saxi TaxID=2320863 RepID=A0A3A3G5G3_9BURK|nr:3'-5' exonuclease family protein [Noviherbaspirillum saxi]RJF97365.1 ethanolamine utilization protein [Noviherbaspirillum saxi]
MSGRKFPRLAFVDLETTGGTATEDRITEVGIIEVDETGVREWSSLVNPGVRIPEFIQSLTGISNAMVQDAPPFAEIADEVAARLADRVFIAHNARFDYGFLKSEFRRTGHAFQPPVLCTVRLSRKLFPGFARHNLDTLAERHRLHVTERHRALGDAQLIWQFWQRIHEEHPMETIDEVVGKLISRPGLPSRLDVLQIESMPFTHGVYLFYGENDLPLYIGKANNLRRRVLSHFSGNPMSAREQQLSQQVQRVEWIETSGELGALLQEVALVKQWKPAYHHKLRDNDEVCSWRLAMRRGRLQPMLITTDDLFFGIDPDLFGLYGDAGKANEAMRAIADAHGLCHVLLGLEKSRGNKACFASQVGKCYGACVGKETLEAHNERVLAALNHLRIQAWPFSGAVGIREKDTFHVVDCWSYLGAARTGEEIELLLQKGRHRFDRDVYQIARKWLTKPDVQIVDLHQLKVNF